MATAKSELKVREATTQRRIVVMVRVWERMRNRSVINGQLPSKGSTTRRARAAVTTLVAQGRAATQESTRQSRSLPGHDEVLCTSKSGSGTCRGGVGTSQRSCSEHDPGSLCFPAQGRFVELVLAASADMGGDLCWLSFLLRHPPHALHLALRLLVEQMT